MCSARWSYDRMAVGIVVRAEKVMSDVRTERWRVVHTRSEDKRRT